MKKLSLFILLLCYGSLYAQISVDNTQTYLEENGQPFFWLGDTGWELFHRLNREEALHYLDTRQQQGFNVIMTVVLAELDGIHQPNYYGDKPFRDIQTLEWDETPGNDPDNAGEYDYWDNVDFVIEAAAERNMYIGLLPTWGDKVVPGAIGPVVFTAHDIAYAYAKKLADRYEHQKNIIWILGGDRPATGVTTENGAQKIIDYRPVWRGMAKALQDVYGKNVFIAYHPGWHTTGYFGEEDSWLSMHAIQSGHASREMRVWDSVRADLKVTPKRPYMDLEPCYEDHPVFPWDGKWTRADRGYFTDYDVRARIYRGVFAGGCGVVYGHHQVWQFTDTGRNAPLFIGDTLIGWQNALQSKGAYQMQHLKKLMLSRPDLHRMEDSLLIVSGRGSDYKDLLIATCDQNKTYALIYLPQPHPVAVNLDRLRRGSKRITWFNPVTGEETVLRKRYKKGIQTFTPPDTVQKDWILAIDDLSMPLRKPGAKFQSIK